MDDDYLKAWTTINKLIREGRSFSGRERNCCFLNLGKPTFSDVSAVTGLNLPDDGRGAAIVDWDHDGDLDLWLTNRTGPRLRFLENQLASRDRTHFLSLRLQGNGTDCNRDAIGARVEAHLDEPGRRVLVRTVAAGNGFLSQSSKWLHFGLGKNDRVRQLAIRWPDGQRLTIKEPKIDQFYELSRNEETLRVWRRPTISHPIANSTDNTIEGPRLKGRTVLVQPLPVPELDYQDLDEQDHRFTPSRLTLINLWATWCTPCLNELDQIARKADDLQRLNVNVLALNVGDETGNAEPQRVREFIDRLQLTCEVGLAPRDLIQRLDVLSRSVVSLQQSLPLPASFLIDANQRVHVIYNGPADIQQVLDDARRISRPGGQALVGHLPGRWISRPPGLRPMSVAMKFLELGAYDDAQDYLRHSQAVAPQSGTSLADMYHVLATILIEQGKVTEALNTFQAAAQVDPQHWRTRFDLGILRFQSGNYALAREQFEAAIRIRPQDADMLNKIGMTLIREGKMSQSIEWFERALAIDASNVGALWNLGEAFQKLGQHDRSVALLAKVIESDPQNADLHFQIAASYMQLRQQKEALRHFQVALELRPQWRVVANNIAWILASTENTALRDPQEAVRLAQQTCEATRFRNPHFLDTLSVAYASAGRFDEAVETVNRAIAIATEEADHQHANRMKSRRSLYKSNKAYREPAS